jgi:hypothetical protein
MSQLKRKLILEFPTPNTITTRSIPKRVARLNHEFWDHTVENHAFVVPAPSEANEVLDCLRCVRREETDVNIADRGVDRARVGEG